jgi:hypothetical protein
MDRAECAFILDNVRSCSQFESEFVVKVVHLGMGPDAPDTRLLLSSTVYINDVSDFNELFAQC